MTTLRINDIRSPIAHEMELFEKKFREAMKSSVPLLDTIMHYIVKRKGKQLRPMFVFLTAGICGGIKEETYRGAALIELLHTATLVHDDVIDDSSLRRGFFSINALWKNKIAVLVGDYLLSKGLLLAVHHKDFNLLEIVSNAVREMSEGELLQIEKARRLDIKENVYYDIIRQKTASLIASCCACGAASSGASAEVIEKLKLFGQNIGIAFQIKDDLFDYEKNKNTGKPSGIDIKDKKLTLPLIYSLAGSNGPEKRKIIHIIKNENDVAEKVAEVIRFVYSKNGIDYAQKKMLEYRSTALSMLDEFPSSEYKESLINLVHFSTDRDR